jgi:hypothetical protein
MTHGNMKSWRQIKHDFLHHFHRPRLDLLVWILVEKLAPSYYRKLDQMLNDTGRYRELSCWRKPFKHEWKKLTKTPITMPLNAKYRPDPKTWVCTCPYFVKSRFLLCKHLVQSVPPMPPIFFLEVKRNRTTPFWNHPALQPTKSEQTSDRSELIDIGSSPASEEHEDEEEEENLVDIEEASGLGERGMLRERVVEDIRMLRDFCDGLEYQLQFDDHRMFQTMEREGAVFMRFARSCISCENRLNATRGSTPPTWERSTASAMFYRARPPHRDRNT